MRVVDRTHRGECVQRMWPSVSNWMYLLCTVCVYIHHVVAVLFFLYLKHLFAFVFVVLFLLDPLVLADMLEIPRFRVMWRGSPVALISVAGQVYDFTVKNPNIFKKTPCAILWKLLSSLLLSFLSPSSLASSTDTHGDKWQLCHPHTHFLTVHLVDQCHVPMFPCIIYHRHAAWVNAIWQCWAEQFEQVQ